MVLEERLAFGRPNNSYYPASTNEGFYYLDGQRIKYPVVPSAKGPTYWKGSNVAEYSYDLDTYPHDISGSQAPGMFREALSGNPSRVIFR